MFQDSVESLLNFKISVKMCPLSAYSQPNRQVTPLSGHHEVILAHPNKQCDQEQRMRRKRKRRRRRVSKKTPTNVPHLRCLTKSMWRYLNIFCYLSSKRDKLLYEVWQRMKETSNDRHLLASNIQLSGTAQIQIKCNSKKCHTLVFAAHNSANRLFDNIFKWA